jgi:hypothetical protein
MLLINLSQWLHEFIQTVNLPTNTGTTIKVSDGIRSERAFDLQK